MKTTTMDPPSTDTLMIRARRSDGGWIVTDLVTTRFGFGATLAEALTGWHEDLAAIAALDGPLGPPISTEALWAKAVLERRKEPRG